MKVKTACFGELEVNKRDIIRFADGILGFEGLKEFFVVDPGDRTMILWLQSVAEEGTAFPILEPKIFMPGHSVNLPLFELSDLDLRSRDEAAVYTILTIPENITEISANLKAPLVINNRTKMAKQVILQDGKLPICHPIYKELRKHISGPQSDDSLRTRARGLLEEGVGQEPVLRRPSPEV